MQWLVSADTTASIYLFAAPCGFCTWSSAYSIIVPAHSLLLSSMCTQVLADLKGWRAVNIFHSIMSTAAPYQVLGILLV